MSHWWHLIFIVIIKIVAADIMEHGIKHYSFGQASKFVFVTLVTGTGIGLSVSRRQLVCGRTSFFC